MSVTKISQAMCKCLANTKQLVSKDSIYMKQMSIFRNTAPHNILLAQKTTSCFRKDTYFLPRLGDCVLQEILW